MGIGKRELVETHASLSNLVLNSCHSLTLTERRIILLTLARIDSSKKLEIGTWYSITVDDYIKLFNLDSEHGYEIIKDEYKRLYERTITMAEGNTTINFRWVEAINFNKETKTLSLKWSSTIIPYISELRENFSRLAMVDIAKIEGSYASRLFDFIFQEKYKGHKGTKEIDIKDLIYLWCIPTSLQKVAELKRIILNPAIKELGRKKLIDIALTNGKKNGKTITSLIFNYRFCK